ncbi:MAG TPA: GAF domain-containing protein, partial [Anaerolineales bacterium]|nr:GAF domain-containing protein [Anaerolineales bacterium]
PILLGNQVTGVISVQSYAENAFHEDDVRLLQTLAHSMSVALENARLFDETQRLLKETEQNNAELAIINRVQEGLARKLDFRGIVELVGEKLGEIFQADTIDMGIYDAERDWTINPYYVDRGQRVLLEDGPTPRPSLAARMLDTREPLLIGTREEGLRLGSLQIPSAGGDIDKNESYLGVPILTENKAIGWMAVQSYQQNAYDQDDLRLLQTLANSMSVALENARLLDETQRLLKETEQRAQELAIINSVQAGLASRLEMQTIYDLVGDKIRDVFDAQAVTIAIFDIENEVSILRYAVEKGERFYNDPSPLTEGHHRYIRSRQPLLINENWEQQMRELGYRVNVIPGTQTPKSTLFVPLIVNDEVIGSVSLQNVDREHAFSDSDIRLLTTLASSMSVALENARLFDETQRLLKESKQHAAELAIINSVQQGLASKLDMQAIYDLVGDKVREIFKADTTYIGIYHPDEEVVMSQYYVEPGQMDRHRHLTFGPFPMGQGLYTHVIRSRQPLLIGTMAEQKSYSPIEIPSPDSEEDLNETYLGVPIMLGADPKGIIAIQSYQQNAFSESDVRLLQTLANSMSVALENARLFDETQRLLKETKQHAAELATINTISTALAGELDLNALIQLVGEQIRNAFSADIVYVALLEEDSRTIRFPYTYGEEFTPLRYGQGLTSKIIETARPLLINQDIEKRRTELGTPRVGILARSYLGVPIFVAGRAIGVISVQSTEQENVFTEGDQHLLGTIAANVGVALQNARLFEEIHTRNREITEALEQQTATSEILKVIASSPTDIQPVLNVIVRNAARLSDSADAIIDMVEEDRMLVAAHFGSVPIFPVGNTLILNRDTVAGRSIIDGHPVQAIHQESSVKSAEFPLGDDIAHEYGYRMTCAVPLIRDGKAIGCITIRRMEPELLTEKQIGLLQIFASQAIIAIENVRLFHELQQRNREVTESLEYQTATSDILSIIAENPTDIQPVLDAVAERAARLCNSYDAAIVRIDGDHYRVAAHWGPVPVTPGGPLNRDSVTGRAMVDKKTIHIHDLLAEPPEEYPLSREYYQTSEQRTMLVTPLVRENEVIGSI